jgi:type IX secretion system PorP/SprF family membrane protein
MNYYSYIHNLYNINPAYCAIGHKLEGIIDVRQKISLNSTNAMIGLNGAITENQGVGMRLISDLRGPFQTTLFDGTYGYKLPLNENSNLIFGLSVGIVNRSLNTSKIQNYADLDQNDPLLNNSNFASTSFTSSAGLIYEYKKFQASFSAPQLIGVNQRIDNFYSLMLARVFHLGNDFKVTPMLFYFRTPVTQDFMSLQVKTEYLKKFWLQVGYQTSEVFNACVGYNLSTFGFAYNFYTSNSLMNVQTSGTNEFILTFKLNRKAKGHDNSFIKNSIEHIE